MEGHGGAAIRGVFPRTSRLHHDALPRRPRTGAGKQHDVTVGRTTQQFLVFSFITDLKTRACGNEWDVTQNIFSLPSYWAEKNGGNGRQLRSGRVDSF